MICNIHSGSNDIKSRRTEQLVSSVLADIAAGMSAVVAARRYGVHPNTIGAWKKKYRGMTVGEIVHVRTIEQDNARLKREVSRLTSENAALQDLLRKNSSGPQRAKRR